MPPSPSGGMSDLPLVAFCFDPFTGQIIANCDVQLIWSVVPGSGGHEHNTGRPLGKLAAAGGNASESGFLAGNTGPSGFLPLVYTAPEASGQTNVTLVVVSSGATVDFTIGVEIPGLVREAVAGMFIDPVSMMHDNHNGYATPATLANLRDTAEFFAESLTELGLPVPTIRINALSLPEGGLFDYQNEWAPPHKGHRRGDQADVRIFDKNRSQRKFMVAAFKDAGFGFPVPNERPEDPASNHWHAQ